jgi:ABC-type oligopeptide transport system substrate-binding subunit/DNA-binding SARP family transcriptional activator
VPTLRLCLLGPLDIRWDDQELPKPPTLKSQSLLAYLILHRDQPQPRDGLVDLFWGDRPEAKARRSLRTALWHIRRGLPDEALILSDRRTVQFDPRADLWLDVDEFEALVGADDIADVQSAVARYRGDFMEGFYDDWVVNERYRVETLFSEALAQLMVGQEERGEDDAALATALRLLGQDSLREDAHQVAMRAYCRLGRRNAALEQYRRCREIVLEELGAEPMVETIELYQEILEGRFVVDRVPAALAAEVPAVPSPPAVGRSPLDVVAPSKLVGREEELAFLNECWQGAEAGQGGLVLISGEAGVGKTRLVEEFANRLRWQGVRVLWGRCYEFERALHYQPVAEALRTVAPSLTADEVAGFRPSTLAEVARLVPEVLQEGTELETTPEADSVQERARLFEGVAGFLIDLSSVGPLLIVLEDLHWAGEPTLQLVHYLARHLAEHQVLMVGTFRSEEVGLEHPLIVLRRRLTRERVARPLRLRRLSSDAVEELVMEMSGAGEAVMPLARRLYKETEGNPFFLMEIVKALFETGVLRVEAGVWQGDFRRMSEDELPLPGAMSEAIQSRAHRLDEDSQEALRLAAVLGREFEFDLLNAVWDRGQEATLEALHHLLRCRVIEEGSGALGRDYAFTHHKIQEVIYSAIPRRHRQHAHALVGGAMESIYGPEPEELAGELAYHFLEAQRHDKTLTEKAIAYLLQAGDRARTFYAHEEAIDHYQRALVLLKEVGDYEWAARTLMKLGLTYHTAFEFKTARQAYQEGFVLWQRAGQRELSHPVRPATHALRVAMVEPTTLDPSLVHDIASLIVEEQLFSGLVELGPGMGVVPDVARSWEVLQGGRTYIFDLRDDVRWSDGVRVTAGDFEYTWKRMLHPATPWGVANYLYDVQGAAAYHQGDVSDPGQVGVRAVDDLTLVVELEGPTGHFLQLLATVYPMPRHVVQARGDAWTDLNNLVTNGPFRLLTWERGESLVLQRNPHYHGRCTGNLERVEFSFSRAQQARLLKMYEDDRLDILSLVSLPPAERDGARQRYVGQYVSGPWLSTHFIAFDVSRPPFNDPRVRRAFVLAADRDTLADVTLRGYAFPATGGLVPPGMPGHSPGIGLPYDPEGARQLLLEAGYPGGRGFPALDCLMRDDPGHRLVGENLRAQWLQGLGAEITWKETEWGKFFNRVSEEAPHMWMVEWRVDYPDPHNVLWDCHSWWVSPEWQGDVYEGLVEQARRGRDQPWRMNMYQKADRILVNDAPILVLHYGRFHVLMKPWVRRYPASPVRLWFWKDVIIDPH